MCVFSITEAGPGVLSLLLAVSCSAPFRFPSLSLLALQHFPKFLTQVFAHAEQFILSLHVFVISISSPPIFFSFSRLNLSSVSSVQFVCRVKCYWCSPFLSSFLWIHTTMELQY